MPRETPPVASSLGRADPTASPGVTASYLRPSAVLGVLHAAGPQGDRSADRALSSGGGALDDASRRASSGGHGLCLGGGHRSEPVSQRQALCLLDWRLSRQSRKSPANANMGKPPRAMRTCARCWPKLFGGSVIPKTITYRRSHTG
jgi:hypothetical protein